MIVLYTNGCIRCNVARSALERSSLEFEVRDACELEVCGNLPVIYNDENGIMIDYWPYDVGKLRKLLGIK